MRKKLFEIIEPADSWGSASKVYDMFILMTMLISIVPLCFRSTNLLFTYIDFISCGIFVVDYFFRLITADFIYGKTELKSFLKYPFRPMAILDLLSILPTLLHANYALKVFRIFRMLKTLRIFKFVRYSKSVMLVTNVLKRERDALMTVGMMAFIYIFTSALIIFQVEPETFDTFFTAVYWATVSLTTVGYGDLYPISTVGRIISMLSSFFGIAVISLPTGLIFSGFQQELAEHHAQKREEAAREE